MNKTEEDEWDNVISIIENAVGRKFITGTHKSSKSCQDCDEIKFTYYTLIKLKITTGASPQSSRKSEDELICSNCKNLRDQAYD